MDLLALSFAQIMWGFVIVAIACVIVMFIMDVIATFRNTNRPNEATLPRARDWQYHDDYFKKIEEFRDDFC